LTGPFRGAALALAVLIAAPAAAGELPIVPDQTLTPGAVLTIDAATVCQPGYAKSARHTSGKVKQQVYREYGITKEQRAGGSRFEVDHLISLQLGGADVAENLWPQSFDTRPWNARTKDALETRLHALVCAGCCRWGKRGGRSRRIGSEPMGDPSGAEANGAPEIVDLAGA
jgi:hypothetical protein